MAKINLNTSLSNIKNRIKNTVTPLKNKVKLPITKFNPNSFISALKTKEVKRKILITIGIILVYRILAAVPLPGIDIKLFNEVFGNNPLNNIFTIVTGGRLDNPSVVAIGLGAYINASIILQLLGTIIPKLEELQKEGERGRRVINSYTRILAVPLNIIQAIVIYTVMKNVAQTIPSLAGLLDGITTLDIVSMVAALTAGSMVLMWLGELITEHGIGNGSSIIITIGILSTIPGLIVRDFAFVQNDLNLLFQNGNFNVLVSPNMITVYLSIIALIVLIFGITFITEAVRKITIQYASRVRATQAGQSSFLPLKINQAGVMPVIFASALLTFPQVFAQIMTSISGADSVLYKIGTAISNSFLGSGYSSTNTGNFIAYEGVYLLLIIAFTFFYTLVTFKPSETADNLKKSGGFIPGIRPGKETEKFILSILLRLTFWGALFLGIVSLIPTLLRLLPNGSNLSLFSGIGGTSLLIVVGVVIDTLRQIKSVAVTRSYDQFK